MDNVVNNFVPDFTKYNDLLVFEGTPVNEFTVVQKEGQQGLLQEMLTPLPLNSDTFVFSDDNDAFDSIIPKEIQTDVEIMQYMKRIKDS